MVEPPISGAVEAVSAIGLLVAKGISVQLDRPPPRSPFAEPLGTQPQAHARLPEPARTATTANRQFAKVPADLGRAATAKLKPGGGAMTIPGLSYTLGRTLYVALTNRCNSVPLFSTRGPGFQMPAASGFAPLPDGVEPSAEQVAEAR